MTLMGEQYYCIKEYDLMAPFFMTIVSSDDHWLFVASTGGLTAGRVDADRALFPYYTVDRIIENADNTGGKTILSVKHRDALSVWEPFISRRHSPYRISRALYKNIAGTSLVFEEINLDLKLRFRYAWRTSAAFGLVKTAWLSNLGNDTLEVAITDGLQNILPAHIAAQSQNGFSVLLDAYKRSELDEETGLGLFSLSSRLTDLAEPSEALRANTVWQAGLAPTMYLLSSLQLEKIHSGLHPVPETDVRGQRGAYFVHDQVEVASGAERAWHLVAEVHQDSASVANLRQWLGQTKNPYELVERDIRDSAEDLVRIVGGADGIQVSGDRMGAERHFANVLFNVMRGGALATQYWIDKPNLVAHINTHNSALLTSHAEFFSDLPDRFTIQTLRTRVNEQRDVDLIRLCQTYLPVTFSRRHGDPSRPWNSFAIHLKNLDGSPRIAYEGNWRDIFQNWEALAYSAPEGLEGMIAVFLNATTIDGYNPYRITQDGVDWEAPDPSDPWANIGYWSDHQIIYLQKLLEASERFYPGQVRKLLQRPAFAFSATPYRIKAYEDILRDPYNTIEYDWDFASGVETRVQRHGADGKLLLDNNGQVFHVTLTEKLLNLLLAKLVNFVPGGGVWMNTQRPEWNDANNALAGKGLSLVTTYYLRRFIAFFQKILVGVTEDLALSEELHSLYKAICDILETEQLSSSAHSDQARRSLMDALGQAGEAYRSTCYVNGLSGKRVHIGSDQIHDFLTLALKMIDQTIAANRRADHLYHAYNTLHLDVDAARVGHLDAMLEGQVAILSSGILEPAAVVALLQQLRQSPLYREDQHSYVLYPDRKLPGFMDKNIVDADDVAGLKLVQNIIERNDPRLIVQGKDGHYHFGGDLRNVRDVETVLEDLAADPDLAPLVEAESAEILAVFEKVFQHDLFTGRSGSFFAYEGLGSIYWHMVSKLLLAVQENIFHAAAIQSPELPALIDAYYDIRAGLGYNKSPAAYGAFPLDPYSHTPGGLGAKQPGMTGMVKEEILTRIGELGLVIESGEIVFNPVLLRSIEWLDSPATLSYWDAGNAAQQVSIPAGAYAFSFCRVPFVVQQSDQNRIEALLANGETQNVASHRLGSSLSSHIFSYDQHVQQITVYCSARGIHQSYEAAT